MFFASRTLARFGLTALTLVGAGGLIGCGMDLSTANQPYALPGKVISGNVHGGVFPIQNATVRLMETQSNGYGGAAKQLWQTTSDSGGYFTFPDTGWTCDSNQFAYITVTSGHTATNAANYNVAQVGIIGNCGQFLANTGEVDKVEVFVSELSTIAAAYTLRGFITIDSTNAASGQQIINISAPANNNAPAGVCTFTSPTSCVAAGLAHGFENAYNMVDSVNYNGQLPSGQARTAPPSNGNGFVPQSLINTLGNILQSCVDSPGGTVATYSSYVPGGTGSSRCGDLFYWATLPGTSSPPTNTLQAAMNMAQYPTNNTSSLYNLQPRAVFFTPTLTTAPHDLTISMFYLTTNFGQQTGNLSVPVGLALDANDDAFILASSASGSSNTQTAVLGIASNGAVLFAGPLNTTYLSPSNIAVDAFDNIWFTNDSTTNGAVLKASASTGAISLGTALTSAAGLAVDRFNNVWTSIDSTTANSIQKFTNTSLSGAATPATQSNALGAGLLSIALDGTGNVWGLNTAGSNSAAVVFPNTGSMSAPAYANSLSKQTLNASAGYNGAPNAAGELFFPLKNQIDDAIYSSNLTTNNLGTFNGASQDSANYNVPNQSEVDGAGNLFFADFESSGRVYEFVPSSSGNMNQGSLYSILPCYPQNGACYVPAVVNGRSMQVDSTGTIWYLANASYYGFPIGVVIQTFGMGAPTWPQLSLQQPGVKPH